MAGIRQTFDKNGNPHPKLRYWYKDWQGKREWRTGTEDPDRTQRIADAIEGQQKEIREQVALGLRKPPTSAEIAKPRPISEIVDEYLVWGEAQGGHGGRPWSPVHRAMRTRHLTEFWPEKIGLKSVSDITIPKVESAARQLLKQKKTGKTVQLHVESIKSFVIWCKGRGYLDSNVLEGIAPFDTTPQTLRRALTVEEIEKLLNVAPAERRLVYETAILTGYRKGELAALKVFDLDSENCTLSLAAKFCKGRKESRQPIPHALALKLRDASKGKPADAPLLSYDFHIHRLFTRDYTDAGIPEIAPGGKLVFHSLRHTYCTLVIESGANVKALFQYAINIL